ncbi:tetratricopeptide repeat protein [Roseomonas sp. CCTCC AB2023176]|uniref:tetratricopeptide repeat protein n=1 Tax=Roseomonas sp. CCTCC AB2023176 TaxID=3342640 RepID=UPI0035E22F70
MSDILDEAREELRAERARKMWARYGGLLAGIAVVVLLGVGGFQAWRWNENRKAEGVATAFLEAHRSTEALVGAAPDALSAAAARFTGIADGSPVGYRTLARLRAAALRSEAGDLDGALADWDRIAGDREADGLYRDLANLLWVLHGLDRTDPARLTARIEPLTAEGSAWRASAREVSALVAMRRGDPEAARRTLQTLVADADAPQGIRDRAGRLLAQLPPAPTPPATPQG